MDAISALFGYYPALGAWVGFGIFGLIGHSVGRSGRHRAERITAMSPYNLNPERLIVPELAFARPLV